MIRNIPKILIILLLSLFLLPSLVLAVATSPDDEEGITPPPIVPEFIDEIADEQLATWERFFGDDWQTVLDAVEASQTGDVEGFIKGGLKLVVLTPKLLPRVGIDLIFPIDENYDGPLLVDPNREELGVEISGHYFQIKDLDSLDSLSVENLLIELLVNGYDTDNIVIKRLLDEDTLEIVSEEVAARTNLPVKIDKSKLYVLDKEKKEEKKIKKLPGHAVREVKTRYKKFGASEVALEMRDGQAVYIIKGSIDGRVLYIFPIKFEVTAIYNAEKGSLDEVNKPWWEVFVF